MDYSTLFSDDVASFMPSPAREIFKKVDLNSIYSLAGGYPDSATFPTDILKDLFSRVMDKYGAKALQYGGTQGVPELRKAVAERYSVNEENVLISTSSQQGIDVSARILLNPGDVVLTVDPTYLGALQSFKSYRAEIVSVQGLKDGMTGVDESILKRAKLFYIISDFQNPSGKTLSLEERMDLIGLSKKYGFLILEDGPYRELRYSGQTLPTIYSLAPERTIHLGSFSKIFAPGLRLGWILAPQEVLHQIYVCKQALDLCPPILNQYMAAEFLESGELDRNLEKSIALYRDKRDFMLSLLEKYMPQGVSWTRPEGGLFLFLTLPQELDCVQMYDKALDAGVAYVAGSFFYADGSHRNTMRLNFSFMNKARMEQGVKILSEVIRSYLG